MNRQLLRLLGIFLHVLLHLAEHLFLLLNQFLLFVFLLFQFLEQDVRLGFFLDQVLFFLGQHFFHSLVQGLELLS